MAKKVRTIPASLDRFTATPIVSKAKRRVAGYARVSTDLEEQATSYEAQMDYYSKYIKARPDWEFVGMYSDEGITATNTNRREGFNSMIKDALDGKIDLIITKSVSRFARNTVDSLTTVRNLKEKGVEIYFEKENIWTLDAKGELLITIMSSLAQEESRSISENTTWGKRKAMADGKAYVAFSTFLGYDRGPNGEFVVNEEQAEIVRFIYKRFLEGISPYQIGKELNEKGIRTPSGKGKWCQSTVLSILENEKYKGDALLQKGFTKDFLTHKRVKNNGEIPQYYVEGHHEGIVTPEQFDLVQAELVRRKGFSGCNIFSSKIRCAECGSFYGPFLWHSNDMYRRTVYRCVHKYGKGKDICRTPRTTEEEIKKKFVKAVNKVFKHKDELIENTRIMMGVACNTTGFKERQAELENILEDLNGQIKHLIAQNSRYALDQAAYDTAYNELADKYETAKAEYETISKDTEEKHWKKERLKAFIATMESAGEVITEFDETLWCGMVHEVVDSGKGLKFVFKSGAEITI